MKVMHCPVNVAGQPWEYAVGLRKLGAKATVMVSTRSPFDYKFDRCLDLPLAKNRRRRIMRRVSGVCAASLYDVIHFHVQTLYPGYVDTRFFRLIRRKTVVNYWGSEARLRSIAATCNPYFNEIEDIYMDEAERRSQMAALANQISTAVVPDPELADYVQPFFQRTEIIPQAIDLTAVRPAPVTETNRPLVVHAPSRRRIKGTSYVLDAVESMKRRGLRFDFRLLENISNHEVRDSMQKADIVVDQLLLGAYGIVSVEAMALGKPVIAYLRDDIAARYPNDLPVICATPTSIEEVLSALVTDPSRRSDIGRRGREFAERYHDSRAVARQLMALYESL